MIKFRKLGFYAHALSKLIQNAANPQVIPAVIAGKKRIVKLRSGLSFAVAESMDLLAIIENILMDFYRVAALQAPTCIVDVGAAFGDMTVALATRFPSSTVIAIEPNPSYFALLQENLRLNGCKNVEAHNIALGSNPEYELFLGAHGGASSIHLSSDSRTKIMIPAEPLSKFLDGKSVDLLKIDCEGAEIDILASAGPSGLAAVKRIVLEYHNYLVDQENKQLFEMLTKQKFSCLDVPDYYDPQLGLMFAERLH